MRASEILVAVENQLRKDQRRRETVYRREWSIASGANRIDLAAINGKIMGCEIKSSCDNLTRLPSQVKSYSAVLDIAILVIEGEAAIKRASRLIPPWWGVWQAIETSIEPQLKEIRAPGTNPSPDPLSLAQLVQRDEAYAILKRRRLGKGLSTATRWRLWNEMASQLSITAIQAEVRRTIKARPDW